MNSDEIKKEIQSFFDSDTLTIVGSGLSLSEGIPGMRDLANELKEKIPSMIKDNDDIYIWNNIDKELLDLGLECVLQKYVPSHNLEKCIRKITVKFIMEKERQVIKDVVSRKKILRIEKYLNYFNIGNNGLKIITTNYDRLIEYACEINNIKVDNMFVGKYLAVFEPEKSKEQFMVIKKSGRKLIRQCDRRVIIYKPHGCLSWHMINGIPYSMPYSDDDDSLIITPGLNKYKAGYSIPFDIEREQENIGIDNSSRYVAIGYGFNDEHLETHLLAQLKKGKKALIVTYGLSDRAKKIVDRYDNVYACYYGKEKNAEGTYIKINKNKIFVPEKELWDIGKLVDEVFL